MIENKRLSMEEYRKLRGLDEKIEEKPGPETPGTPNVPWLCMCTPNGEIVYLKNMIYYCDKCGKSSFTQSDFTRNTSFRQNYSSAPKPLMGDNRPLWMIIQEARDRMK